MVQGIDRDGTASARVHLLSSHQAILTRSTDVPLLKNVDEDNVSDDQPLADL